MARFEFGKNWEAYIDRITPAQIDEARHALSKFLGVSDLQSKSFLDIGCGSGVHSLAACQLGAARIVSFDYDSHSVRACQRLKDREAPGAIHWSISGGDILTPQTDTLGTFDVVYAWGVLHHTGAMWKAIEHAAAHVAANGLFFLAIYNRHWTSPLWRAIKRFYCGSPKIVKSALLGLYASAEFFRLALVKRLNPFRFIANYPQQRGMRWTTDLRDWLGGYPYEFASPAELTQFMTRLGFQLVKERPASSIGCSELLYRRTRS